MDKLIISAALTGAGTYKSMNPNVPETADEIAEDVIRVADAGAAVVHIHVRDENGRGSMDTDRFEEVYEKIQKKLKEHGKDVVINLTTSGIWGAQATDEMRLAHLQLLKPEMCSFDAGTMNWNCGSIFENSPQFLEKLCQCTAEHDIKPEIEIFDIGMIGNVNYYIQKGMLKTPCYFQFIMGVLGGAEGTAENLQFLVNKLPEGSKWSVSGIGKAHIPMMLAGLSMGCNGIRVGLEDNLYYSKGVKATNSMLVARAAEIGRLAGREIASAEDAREILGLRGR